MASASAKNFPSLALAAFSLCIRAGGDNPLKDYAGKPRVIPGKPQIDQLIDDYIARRAAAAGAGAPEQDMVDETEAIRMTAVAAHGRLTNNP